LIRSTRVCPGCLAISLQAATPTLPTPADAIRFAGT
jgi:hypothetical protein